MSWDVKSTVIHGVDDPLVSTLFIMPIVLAFSLFSRQTIMRKFTYRVPWS